MDADARMVLILVGIMLLGMALATCGGPTPGDPMQSESVRIERNTWLEEQRREREHRQWQACMRRAVERGETNDC